MTFNAVLNFWEQHPQLRALETFEDFYKKDKSENKKESSNVLWAIAYCYHPKSEVFNAVNKLEDVKKTIIKNPKFKWDTEENKILIAAYKDTILTAAEKSYLNICEHFIKRDDFMSTINYNSAETSIEQIKLVEDMIAKTPKLYLELDRIKKLLKEEESKETKKEQTMSETGDI